MTHDPVCPVVVTEKFIDAVLVLPGTDLSKTNLGKVVTVEEGECRCDLIARVREDERGKAAARLSLHWQETVGRGEPTVAEDELAAVLGTESPTVLHQRVGGCIPHYDSGYAAALRDAVEAVKALPKWRLLEAPGKYVRRDKAVAAIEDLSEGSKR